jgi:hypothetical protein
MYQENASSVFLRKAGCPLGQINTGSATAITCTAYSACSSDFTMKIVTYASGNFNLTLCGACATGYEANNTRECNPIAYVTVATSGYTLLPVYLTKTNIPTGDTTHWQYGCINTSLIFNLSNFNASLPNAQCLATGALAATCNVAAVVCGQNCTGATPYSYVDINGTTLCYAKCPSGFIKGWNSTQCLPTMTSRLGTGASTVKAYPWMCDVY